MVVTIAYGPSVIKVYYKHMLCVCKWFICQNHTNNTPNSHCYVYVTTSQKQSSNHYDRTTDGISN